MPLSTYRKTVQEGDDFLICSDGFWEFVYEKEMETDLQSTNSAEQWSKGTEVSGNDVSGNNVSAEWDSVEDGDIYANQGHEIIHAPA
ncbi:MAG: hypothetical protein K2K54_08050 [Lachnospiraceae bacterium]|nr:hypothetical protein [Lachnospiraceae bacterium]